jgi:hypothetical protein
MYFWFILIFISSTWTFNGITGHYPLWFYFCVLISNALRGIDMIFSNNNNSSSSSSSWSSGSSSSSSSENKNKNKHGFYLTNVTCKFWNNYKHCFHEALCKFLINKNYQCYRPVHVINWIKTMGKNEISTLKLIRTRTWGDATVGRKATPKF